MNLQPLFHPETVAIVGSMSPGKLGAALSLQLIEGGYQGKMFAVNPKGDGFQNIPGFTSLASIQDSIDLAVIASPASTVVSVLEDCGKAKIPFAVLITSGFSETGNIEGEKQIIETARKQNIRFIGPNSAGMVNTGEALYPTLELRPPAGEVALISQSGALGGVVLAAARKLELGISKFVSYGNCADINEVDLLNYLSTDDETRVVAVYIESVRKGRDFMQAMKTCSAQKPVIVIKSGRTGAGQRATASHTGSLAGSDAVYETAIRQSGAIRVGSVEEMLDLCQGFLQTRPFTGNKIAIVTNSGGPGVLAADRAEELGMQVIEPGHQVQESLKTFLPGHCSLKNPIDLTVEGTEEGYRQTLQAMLSEFDCAIAINVLTPYLDAISLANGVVQAARDTNKPILANFLPEQIAAESITYLKQNGITNYSSGERAATVLKHMASYYQSQSLLNENTGQQQATQTISEQTLSLPGESQMLEPTAMKWLEENHIPVPPFRFCTNTGEAIKACQDIGYPVVMKVVSPQILHKSDSGGVIVNIHDDDEAKSAFERIQIAAQGKDFRGVVIYPMIDQAQEVLVGMSRDAQFGPVIAFGLGGIYTEIWKDVSLRIAPIHRDEALEMIYSIKSIPLLTGARGKPPCDLEALANVLVNFSKLPFRYPEIQEIDLNPVFLFKEGLVVGDVRVIRSTVQ